MTTRAQLRKAALAMPEAEESRDAGTSLFSVRGQVFASDSKNGQVYLTLSEDVAQQVLRSIPGAEPWQEGDSVGVHVPLPALTGMELNSMVRKAWMSCAPEEMAAAYREALQGVAPSGPDALPKSIGKPATRALLGAGVRNLQDVAGKSRDELLALHGVGPRAIPILEEALAQRGLSFKTAEEHE